MMLASISGGQSLGKPLPDLSRQGQRLSERPFSVSCRKSKPFKPSDAVGFDEKSRFVWLSGGCDGSEIDYSGKSLWFTRNPAAKKISW
jgi:hypothetical protein